MIKLNCLLKDRCVNMKSYKCLKCIYNRDVKLEDNFVDEVESMDLLRKDLKNDFDNDCNKQDAINKTIKGIDESILNTILQHSHGIDPKSLDGILLKKVITDIMSGDESVINKFIPAEDRDNVYEIINMVRKNDESLRRNMMSSGLDLNAGLREAVIKHRMQDEESTARQEVKRKLNSLYGQEIMNELFKMERPVEEAVKPKETISNDLNAYFKSVEDSIFRR